MAEDPVISVQNVSKVYRIWANPAARLTAPLQEALAGMMPGSPGRWLKTGAASSYRDFWALKDIGFEVKKGEAVGIIGRNGSGKSTLLQIIAGTLQPTTGTVRVRGRVAALLELGSGFNPEFTGRDNVYLNGAVLGLPRSEIDARFDAIAAFADIGDFIDQPVKTYSSGMMLRLAFAVQTQVEPDVLIIDEALAVGDALFQKRCFQQMEKLRSAGATLLFVSHDQESIRTLTSRAILLKAGRQYAYGLSSEVVLEYRRLMHEEERLFLEHETKRLSQQSVAPSTPSTIVRDPKSFGDREAEVVEVTVLDAALNSKSIFYPGDEIVVRIKCIVNLDSNKLNVGMRIRNKEGVKIYSWGTLNQDISIWSQRATGPTFWGRNFTAGETVTVEFRFLCTLGLNLYEIQAAVSEELDQYYENQRMLHWRDEAAFFQVYMAKRDYFFGGSNDLRMTARVL